MTYPQKMPSISKDDIAEYQNQRRRMYDNSRPHLTDVSRVREQVDALLDRRLREGLVNRNAAAREYSYLCAKFPKILDALLSYKQERLGEAKEIFGKMLDELEKVQKGGKSVHEASDHIEEDLGHRFYKRDS